MYVEIEKQALKLLEKECPDEVTIYTRWEQCIKMYAAGFRSVPQTMEEVLDWYNNCDPFERGYRRGRLSIPLHLANNAIHSGACRPWIDHYFANHMRTTIIHNYRAVIPVKSMYRGATPGDGQTGFLTAHECRGA